MQDLLYSWFKKKFFELSGIDLNSYKDNQTKRRIYSYLQNKEIKNLVEFYKNLKIDKNLLEDFKNFLTINVSYFFRDIEKWKELKNKYLPEILNNNKNIKIWSAGASIGCEPYTVAILLEEYKKINNLNYSILATDIDVSALNKAKIGIYNTETLKYVEEDILKNYFIKEQNGDFKIVERIKKNIKFKIHDLNSDEFPENFFDIIICRNVVIYFDEEAKLKLYKRFHSVLKDGGILFIGASEIIFKNIELGFKNLSAGFYKKI
jgi:chemotaxis protein methyltransferase CheR